MKTVFRLVSFASLALMLASAALVCIGAIDRKAYHLCALLGTIGWFATVPLWMTRRLHQLTGAPETPKGDSYEKL